MKTRRGIRWLMTVLAVTAAFLHRVTPALACPLCMSAADPKGIRALQSGILILLIPALGIFCGLFALTFRYRNDSHVWRRSALPEMPLPADADLFGIASSEVEPHRPG